MFIREKYLVCNMYERYLFQNIQGVSEISVLRKEEIISIKKRGMTHMRTYFACSIGCRVIYVDYI